MCKSCVVLKTVILLVIALNLTSCAPARMSFLAQLNPNYLRAMAAYKRLEPKLPRNELRALTTIGILNGAVHAEQQMEHNLIEIVKDLLLNTDTTQATQVMPKIANIENQLKRDERAIEILASAMDLAIGTKTLKEFQLEMEQKLQKIKRVSGKLKQDADITTDFEKIDDDNDMEQRVSALRRHILQHVNSMKLLVEDKIEQTLDYLIDEADESGLLAKASNKLVRKRQVDEVREEPAEIRMIKSILTEDDFRENLIDTDVARSKDDENSLDDNLDLDDLTKKIQASRHATIKDSATATTKDSATATTNDSAIEAEKDSKTIITLPTNRPTTATTLTTTTTTTTITPTVSNEFGRPAKQEEGSPEIFPNEEQGGGGGGGLVALIGSLSGGEGGSDVGALLGALTGLVSTLFGPGGLDVESLISTATSLISGLLAGNKNFGTVLGQYVGTALDGLSGGGGAVNNGQFLGNFLGTVVASLSADPEEDDVPPKPLIFVQNVISSFIEAKNRVASDEMSGERNGDSPTTDAHPGGGGGGSDSAGFIKHIVSTVVGGAVSFILNAALGASSGASSASSTLFTSSSSGHKPPGRG